MWAAPAGGRLAHWWPAIVRDRDGCGGRYRRLDGIHIIAGDDRASRRQHAYEMRVAVIDNVKQVEIAYAARASVGSPTCDLSADRREARAVPPADGRRVHRRAIAGRNRVGAILPAAMSGSVCISMSAMRSMLCHPSSRRSHTTPSRSALIGMRGESMGEGAPRTRPEWRGEGPASETDWRAPGRRCSRVPGVLNTIQLKPL